MSGRFAPAASTLAKASWSVVRADKELMILPVLSVLALLVLVGSFALPLAALGAFNPEAMGPSRPWLWIVGFVFYVVAYFVGIFFNTALVGAAMIRMDGGNPDGRRRAGDRGARVGGIFGDAVIAATVGRLRQALEERVGWVGRFVVKLFGVGWALATFLVVPVLVTRDVGPDRRRQGERRPAARDLGREPDRQRGPESRLRRWRTSRWLVGGRRDAARRADQRPGCSALVVLFAVVALVVLTALQATMQGVYSAALYRYATEPRRPDTGFYGRTDAAVVPGQIGDGAKWGQCLEIGNCLLFHPTLARKCPYFKNVPISRRPLRQAWPVRAETFPAGRRGR